jgi:hypothetical protein
MSYPFGREKHNQPQKFLKPHKGEKRREDKKIGPRFSNGPIMQAAYFYGIHLLTIIGCLEKNLLSIILQKHSDF